MHLLPNIRLFRETERSPLQKEMMSSEYEQEMREIVANSQNFI